MNDDPKWTRGLWMPPHYSTNAGKRDACRCKSILTDQCFGAIAYLSVRDGRNDSPPEHEAIANGYLIASAPELYEALMLLEELEASRDSCPSCEGYGEAELCELCFPKADDARVKRRLALAKARGVAPQ